VLLQLAGLFRKLFKQALHGGPVKANARRLGADLVRFRSAGIFEETLFNSGSGVSAPGSGFCSVLAPCERFFFSSALMLPSSLGLDRSFLLSRRQTHGMAVDQLAAERIQYIVNREQLLFPGHSE